MTSGKQLDFSANAINNCDGTDNVWMPADDPAFVENEHCCGCGGGIEGICRDTDDGLTDLYGDNCLSYAGMNRFEAPTERMPAEYGCGNYDAELPGT